MGQAVPNMKFPRAAFADQLIKIAKGIVEKDLRFTHVDPNWGSAAQVGVQGRRERVFRVVSYQVPTDRVCKSRLCFNQFNYPGSTTKHSLGTSRTAQVWNRDCVCAQNVLMVIRSAK